MYTTDSAVKNSDPNLIKRIQDEVTNHTERIEKLENNRPEEVCACKYIILTLHIAEIVFEL